MTDPGTCPNCREAVAPDAFFCSRCGTKLKEGMTTGRALAAYLISAFIPPFGLFPGLKYIRSTDEKTKRVGVTAIVLTFISLLVTAVLTVRIISELNTQIGTQIELYNQLQ